MFHARSELKILFKDRSQEIKSHLEFLKNLDDAKREGGIPRFLGTEKEINVTQNQILISIIYLQLYNLVEAIMNASLEYLERVIAESGKSPSDLNQELLEEWVRFVAKTRQKDLSAEKRFEAALMLHTSSSKNLPVEFKIEKGGGGNWDDEEIEKFCKRIGCDFAINQDIKREIKRDRTGKEKSGYLRIIREKRNQLAHGNLSFADCGKEVLSKDVSEAVDAVIDYLSEYVRCFSDFLDSISTSVID